MSFAVNQTLYTLNSLPLHELSTVHHPIRMRSTLNSGL
uniref:Uncharacterized protein n=1 Tax=Anguilla anguilla TaxID=7936 RepID=A0A0E9RYS1_ANGAN